MTTAKKKITKISVSQSVRKPVASSSTAGVITPKRVNPKRKGESSNSCITAFMTPRSTSSTIDNDSQSKPSLEVTSEDPSDSPAQSLVESLQTRLSEESSKTIRVQLELEARTMEVASLRSLIDDLKLQLNKSKIDQLQQLDTEEALRSEAIEREELIRNLEMGKAQWEGESSKLAAALNNKEQMVTQLGDLIAALRTEIQSLKDQPNAYADVWIQQVRMTELEQLVELKSGQLTESQSSVDSLTKEVADCYQCIDKLEVLSHAHEEANERLDMQVEALKESLLVAESSLFVKTRDFNEVQDALRETIEENEQMHGNLSKTLAELKDAYECIDLLEGQIKTLETEKDALVTIPVETVDSWTSTCDVTSTFSVGVNTDDSSVLVDSLDSLKVSEDDSKNVDELDRKIVTLKMALFVANEKFDEATKAYQIHLKELQEAQNKEMEKWKTTSDEQTGLVQKLYSSLQKSANRIQFLEDKLAEK